MVIFIIVKSNTNNDSKLNNTQLKELLSKYKDLLYTLILWSLLASANTYLRSIYEYAISKNN